MAQAYDAVIATIVVASDATSVTKAMVKSTTWRQGTSGEWNSTDCTLTAGNTYQFRTPNLGFGSLSVAVLPNIKASVTVAWDTSGTAISTVGDYFMHAYADNCSNLTSLGVPDTSGLTSAGDGFMSSYANNCPGLTSLGVPDTSGLTSVGDGFMRSYASSCSSLTSLGIPDTSGLTSAGYYLTNNYATLCSSLTKLILPSSTGWFETHNISWSVPSGRLNYLYGYVPNSTSETAWEALTATGKTLYLNYIRDTAHVVVIGTTYSRESASSLGSGDTDLATIFSSADYTTVGTDDDNYVNLEGIQEYFQFLFKEKHTNNTDNFRITWKGKSTLAPSASTVYLQIYNRTTSTWTTLASNNTASANTKFTLESTISSNLSDYYDSNYVISARVYQDVVV